MRCPLCRQRPAKRQCPALGREICAVCCGTGRGATITCPTDCAYLASAVVHPPASVRRRQERDVGFIVAMRDGLTPRQSDLFWAVLTFLTVARPDSPVALTDDDLAQAVGAQAATLETADRGVIYEHRPDSLPALGLLNELRAFLAEIGRTPDGGPVRGFERDAAVVLRRIERGARGVRGVTDEGPGTALAIIRRVMAAARESAPTPGDRLAGAATRPAPPAGTPGSRIILP